RFAFVLVPAIGISFLFLSPAMAGPPKPKIDSFSCNPDGTVRLKTTGKDKDQNLVRIEGRIDRYPDVNTCQTFSGLENSITVIDETFAATGSKTITQAADTVCIVGKGYRAVVKDTDAASNTGMTLTQKCCTCESLPRIGPFGGDDTGFIPRGTGS